MPPARPKGLIFSCPLQESLSIVPSPVLAAAYCGFLAFEISIMAPDRPKDHIFVLWEFIGLLCGHLCRQLCAKGTLWSTLASSLFFLIKKILVGGRLYVSCGILVPQPGFEPGLPALGVQSPSHWTTRDASCQALF